MRRYFAGMTPHGAAPGFRSVGREVGARSPIPGCVPRDGSAECVSFIRHSFMGRVVRICLCQIIFRTVIAFSANRNWCNYPIFFTISPPCSSSNVCLFCSASHPVGNCEGNAGPCYRKRISWRLFIRHNLLTVFLSGGKNRNETLLWLTNKNLNVSKGENIRCQESISLTLNWQKTR